METLYDMTKRLGKGQGESVMWDTVKIVSEAVEQGMSEKDKEALMAKIYGMLSGGHFDEDHATEIVAKMYYEDKDGEKRHAPYWTIPQISEIYESVKDEIPAACTEWDFYVAFNMVAADHWCLLHEWWPSLTQEQFIERIKDLTVNWLDDEDSADADKKVWNYLHK